MRPSDAVPIDAPPFLVDGNDTPALVVDAHGTVLSGTPDARAFLGHRLDLPFPSDSALIAPDASHTAGTFSGETTLLTAAGAPECYRYTARLLAPVSDGGPTWLVLLARTDVPATGQDARDRAERRSRLAHVAAMSIGTTLDLHDMADRLARLLVPDFADLAVVDIPVTVLESNEPPRALIEGVSGLRRVAVVSEDGRVPPGFGAVGEIMPVVGSSMPLAPVSEGSVVLASDMDELREALRVSPEDAVKLIPRGGHAMVAAPLVVQDRMLGVLAAWRLGTEGDYDLDDAEMLVEITSRGALGFDNARRYAREHRTALALQRSLLPPLLAHTPAARTAGTYVPARDEAGVGGDWFDVLPLSSLRTGFVVGDVVGHGLGSTVAMGRLRTAVQTVADLDLEPGELLGHLDDLVVSRWLGHDADTGSPDLAAVGATVLYAIYDPVDARCTIAAAGHPPPLVLRPGRAPEFLELSPGPPLGVGGMPFETVDIELPPGSLIAFYTDGLVERRGGDIGDGMARFAEVMARHRDQALETIGPEVLAEMDPPHDDDVALLLAATRVLPEGSVAEWELPADPSVVSRARELTAEQLVRWGLGELAFTSELVVSELITNAIRYGGSPVGLRLIRDDILVCEVSDPSNSQPRMRRAVATDEGGRGLFLVAQMTSRWGSRYRRTGKTIWAEQSMDPSESPFGERLLDIYDVDL
ncbi:serine/threonine-protein phosphatase [Yinghuangia sp. ASG 101]|uniref:ATP-binding SpoIIE family protein phosphatase n=1 Tax=Yinghuangia sp. ASG 101 TaxID=2896848 RepID=UPI001E462106|nr:ATP-binding SpoIIE family protein phosphatase [Yinghuangia sp. ASG 101]UGQ13180.1 serine/threonine-protein phosphatase [Yinghuangia sp. ASG 101]